MDRDLKEKKEDEPGFQEVEADRPRGRENNALLIREPAEMGDFTKKVKEARARFKGKRWNDVHREEVGSPSVYHKRANVMYYYDNQINTVEDIMRELDRVCESEKERFRVYTDFGVIKERIEGENVQYSFLSPLEQNLQRETPMVIKDRASLEKYKNYVLNTLIRYQEFTQGDTKEMIIAFHSMMVVCYRMPQRGAKAGEWVRKHCLKGVTQYIDAPSNICFWISLTESVRKAKEMLLSHYNIREDKQKRIKEYPGLYLDEIKDVAESQKMSIVVYVYDSENNTYSQSEDLSAANNNSRKKKKSFTFAQRMRVRRTSFPC
jgi:hypothetical protein